MRIIKKHCHKKTVRFYNFGKENLKVAAFEILPICIMVLFEIYQSFKGHFLNELCVFFNLQVYNKIVEVFI